MKKSINNITFFLKSSTFYIFLISIITIILDVFFKFFYIINLGDIIGLSGVIFGFLIAALAIFVSLPKENLFFRLLIKYNKIKTFYTSFALAIIFMLLSIFLSFFNIPTIIPFYFFFIGLLQTALIVVYLLYICFNIRD